MPLLFLSFESDDTFTPTFGTGVTTSLCESRWKYNLLRDRKLLYDTKCDGGRQSLQKTLPLMFLILTENGRTSYNWPECVTRRFRPRESQQIRGAASVTSV